MVRATELGARIEARVADPDDASHIPHLCPVEVTSALRGLVLGRKVSEERATRALAGLAILPATRHPVEPLLSRAWALRHNLTAYDAVYVALAESLDATLITADGKLDSAAVRRLISVEVIR